MQITDEMRRAARAVGESKAPQLGAVSIAFADMCEEALTAALAAAQPVADAEVQDVCARLTYGYWRDDVDLPQPEWVDINPDGEDAATLIRSLHARAVRAEGFLARRDRQQVITDRALTIEIEQALAGDMRRLRTRLELMNCRDLKVVSSTDADRAVRAEAERDEARGRLSAANRWPDPLTSPVADAIRAGHVDDTDILSQFDKMAREIEIHRAGNAAGALADARALLAEAKEALTDAVDCIAAWGSYANDYAREKHDLDGDILRARATLARLDAAMGNPITEQDQGDR